MVCVGHTDGHQETEFHLPASTLTPALGFGKGHDDLMGHLLHTVKITSVDSPCPVGIKVHVGDKQMGHHATHILASEAATVGFGAVATHGTTTFDPPISINALHNGGSGLHENVKNLVKRGHRWHKNIDNTVEQLMTGLQEHTGTHNGQEVARVLVPLHGDHPVTRALTLNTSGHLSQYSPSSRTTIPVAGQDHVIMERAHAQQICETLQDNLRVKSPVARHGITFKMSPLQTGSPQGDVKIHLSLHKHNASIVLGDPHFKSEAHPPHLTSHAALTMIGDTTGGASGVVAPDVFNADVIGARLAASKLTLPPAPKLPQKLASASTAAP